jgi:hypothetical protein
MQFLDFKSIIIIIVVIIIIIRQAQERFAVSICLSEHNGAKRRGYQPSKATIKYGFHQLR